MNFGGGGGSNPPPWARQGGGGAGYGFNNQQFGQQGLGQQQSGLSVPISGFQGRTTPQGGAAQPKQKVFTGRITKLKDTFGFVDEDVFFQNSVCKGGTPQVGDQVLVEANYNENMPFKWNATRLQIVPNTQANPAPQPHAFQQAMAQQVQQQMSVLQAAQAAAALNRNAAAQSLQRAAASPQLTPSPYKPVPTQQYKPASSSTSYNAGKPPPSASSASYSSKPASSGTSYNSSKPPLAGSSSSGSSSSRPSRFEQRSSGSAAPPVSSGRPSAVARPSGGRHDPSPRRERSPRRYSPTPSVASSTGRRRSRSPKPRSRSPVRRRSRSPPPRKRSRSRSSKRTHRRSSPRREKATPRYNVQVSQHALDAPLCRLTDLRARYSNMYIPSDYTRVLYPWINSFALTHTLTLGQPVSYHVLKNEVSARLLPGSGYTEPADASFAYSAKVLLLASPSLEDIYKTCCFSSARSDEMKHPARLLQFLVGTKSGKSEPMAIGGAWSQSLDGPDPDTNPQTLINTAIRTTLQLTGIDLSKCTRWYRFVEVEYLRSDSKKHPVPRREKVVMFLPDVWSCVPSMLDYMALQDKLTTSLMRRVRPPPAEPMETEEIQQEAGSTAEEDASSQEISQKADQPARTEEKTESREKTGTEAGEKAGTAEDKPESEHDTSLREESEIETSLTEEAAGEGAGQATHWSELDVKSMKVAELRTEIEARGESSKGLKKPQLVTKLNKLLKAEEEEGVPAVQEVASTQDDAEANKDEALDTKENGTKSNSEAESADAKESETPKETETPKEVETPKEKESDEKESSKEAETENEKAKSQEGNTKEKQEVKKVEDPNTLTAEQSKEKIRLEKYYKLPADPCVVVHPDRTARNGTFDCAIMSLNVLLDYRQDDNKEHTFEVSLFAEAFNEMLMRDFGFTIYCRLEEHAEHLMREDLRRKEEERKAKEEKERLEQEEKERKEREEKERQEREERERKEREERERKEKEEKELKEKEEKELKEKEEKEQKDEKSTDEQQGDDSADNEKEKEKPEETMDTAESETVTTSAAKPESDKENRVSVEDKTPEPKEDDKEKAEVKIEAKNETIGVKKEEKNDVKKEEKRSSDADKSEEPDRKRTRHSENESKQPEKHSGPQVYTTVDKESLLAFSYYDASRSGYITERDLEEIIHSLGLQLSRHQVRRLVHKAASSGQVHYKQFAEVLEDKVEEYEAKRVRLDRAVLAKGNRSDEASSNVAPDSSAVMFQGAFVDLENVMSRLFNADSQRLDTEKELKFLIELRGSLEKSVERLEDKNKKYGDDYTKVKDQLSATEKDLMKARNTGDDYKRILMTSSQDLTKVLGRINTVIAPAPSQSGDSRSNDTS